MTSVPISDDLWIISDTHFGHANIIKYQGRPIEHDKIMLENWRLHVGPDEPILHLGDVWFGKGVHGAEWSRIVARLPGEKYLILGNHDRDHKLLKEAGFEIVEPFVHQGIAFTHRPISNMYPLQSGAESVSRFVSRLKIDPTDWTLGWKTNVHGHTHGNQHHASEGALARGRRYVNVSIEMTNYHPVRLGEVLA